MPISRYIGVSVSPSGLPSAIDTAVEHTYRKADPWAAALPGFQLEFAREHLAEPTIPPGNVYAWFKALTGIKLNYRYNSLFTGNEIKHE